MDYKERYTTALERARERYSACSAPALLEYIFPELKESEDEKIREVLLDYFQAYKDKEKWGITKFNGIPTDSIIAWLEKQGHMLDPDKVVEWLKINMSDDSAFGMAMITQFKEDFGL